MNHPRATTAVVCSVLILTGIGISLTRDHMKANAERRAQRYEQLDQDLTRFIEDMRPLARQLKMGAVCRAIPEEAVSATCTVFDEAETQENQEQLEQKLSQFRGFVNDHPRFINSLPPYRQRLIDEMVNLDVDAEVQKLEDEARQQQEELNDG